MELFKICTISKAIFDEDWNWTGEMELDYVFAYNEKDIKELEFISENNNGIFEIWEEK